ncbi:hypothetical protein [Methylobacterium sp. GC_Met_2]|uniref:hypothetical protein n=1 Tax=Methylobacterium sp. GC_Met_2 TaxID=2937376 RepID=UPI00226B7265|nr:hypothetical protein [Methylobacterium sp. GC_Met_2]
MAISCKPDPLPFVAEEWRQRYTPGLTPAFVLEVLCRVQAIRPFYTSEDIGRRLRMTYDEKVALRITHIAPFDVDAEEVRARKLAEERARVKSHRLATGKTKTPRQQSIARTIPRRPGETTGSYYRRVKREGLAAVG